MFYANAISVSATVTPGPVLLARVFYNTIGSMSSFTTQETKFVYISRLYVLNTVDMFN